MSIELSATFTHLSIVVLIKYNICVLIIWHYDHSFIAWFYCLSTITRVMVLSLTNLQLLQHLFSSPATNFPSFSIFFYSKYFLLSFISSKSIPFISINIIPSEDIIWLFSNYVTHSYSFFFQIDQAAIWPLRLRDRFSTPLYCFFPILSSSTSVYNTTLFSSWYTAT